MVASSVSVADRHDEVVIKALVLQRPHELHGRGRIHILVALANHKHELVVAGFLPLPLVFFKRRR